MLQIKGGGGALLKSELTMQYPFLTEMFEKRYFYSYK